MVVAAGYRNCCVHTHDKTWIQKYVFTIVLFDSVTSLHANMVHTDQIQVSCLKKVSVRGVFKGRVGYANTTFFLPYLKVVLTRV